jgi:drug/metabolite transporter (DMT)-like permease
VSLSREHVVGSLIVLANSACYGTYLVVVRPLAERYDPLALLAMMFIAGVPMVAPLGVHAWQHAAALDGGDVAILGFLVAVPTVTAYGLVQVALRHAESTLVAAYIYLQPLMAAIGAIALLDEHVMWGTVAGGAIVLAGVWLAAKRRA